MGGCGQSFTAFTKLPKELQDEVWDQAILNRACHGQLQAFGWGELQPVLLHTEPSQGNPSTVSTNLKCPLYGPFYHGPLAESHGWESKDNPSGYVSADAKLWASGKPAQQAITRHWDRVKGFRKHHHCILQFTTPSGKQNILVQPETDVFLIKLANLFMQPFDANEISTQLMSIFKIPLPPPICLEYDLEWRFELAKLQTQRPMQHLWELDESILSVAELMYAACQPDRLSVLYILDDCLVPHPGCSESELVGSGIVFLGKGCRYVNVDGCDVGTKWVARDGNNDATAPRFVDELHNFAFQSFWRNREWSEFTDSNTYQGFGALACLPDSHFQGSKQ